MKKNLVKAFSPIVAFTFCFNILTLPGCGDAEKLIKEATGQPVADDADARNKLTDVNQLTTDAINRLDRMAVDIQSAKTYADQGNSDQASAIWINNVLPTANDLSTNLELLNTTEKKLQDNIAAARTTGESHNELLFLGAVVAVAGVWAFGKFCQRKGEEMKQLKQQEADALANGDSETLNRVKNKQIEVGQEVGNELGKSVMITSVGAGPGVIGKLGKGLEIIDTANSVTTEISASNKLKVVGSTTACKSTPEGSAPSSNGCKTFVKDASSLGKKHIIRDVPVGTYDIMALASGLSRIYSNAVDILETIKASILKGLIPINQATVKKIKDNEGGSYTEPGAPLPVEITVSATGSASGGYSSAPQDQTIDGSSQLVGYTVTGVSVTLTYEAYTVPDQFQIIYEGSVIFDSGVTSGGGSTTIDVGGSSPYVTIRVMTPDSGTAWVWDASVAYIGQK
ncbi:MAG: hypothetical protein HQK85_03715 [Nitrospinae bacterium]|nr:hypothetical protein [Nitrospinota bacterium]